MQSSVFRFSMTNQISLRHKLCSSYLRLSEKIKSISRFFLHRSLTKDILTLPYPSKNRLFYVQVYKWMWFWRFSGILFYTKRKAECNQHYRNNLLHSKQAYTFHFLPHLSWQNHTSKYSSKKGEKHFLPHLNLISPQTEIVYTLLFYHFVPKRRFSSPTGTNTPIKFFSPACFSVKYKI